MTDIDRCLDCSQSHLSLMGFDGVGSRGLKASHFTNIESTESFPIRNGNDESDFADGESDDETCEEGRMQVDG